LHGCLFAGVPELFAAIKAAGRTLGIYSDYAATEKLSALGLTADFIVSADDLDIAVLKPNPKGLLRLMERAGALPHETLLIGDRILRDGIAAKRAGVRALIRSSSTVAGWQAFRSYRDPAFASLTARSR
jgi:putative hydrolase of the HAD superfamily